MLIISLGGGRRAAADGVEVGTLGLGTSWDSIPRACWTASQLQPDVGCKAATSLLAAWVTLGPYWAAISKQITQFPLELKLPQEAAGRQHPKHQFRQDRVFNRKLSDNH